MSSRLRLAGLLSWLALGLFAYLPAAGAQPFPSKRITLVVPFAAGGSTDLVARVLADELSTKLGQVVVVENKPGGGAMIGADYVAKAEPNGYTLLLGSADNLGVGPAMRRRSPFNPLSDFTPIGLVTRSPMVFAVNPRVTAKDLKELATQTKQSGKSLNYGTPGVGTILHLTAEMLQLQTGMPLLHVPYRGGGPAVVDAISGQIDMVVISPPSVRDQIHSGQLRGLAQTGEARHPMLPMVPTTAELGMPALNPISFFAVVGPKGLPSDVARTLSEAVYAVAADPKFKERMINVGGEGEPLDAERLRTFMAQQVDLWKDIVATAKISPVD